MAKKMLKISVQLVTTEGKSRKKNVEVAPNGASVQQLCEAGKIDTRDKDFTVNGKPATLDTHVGPNDVLEAKESGQQAVAVSERPKGS